MRLYSAVRVQFASSVTCESVFSLMNFMKYRLRVSLKISSVDELIRISQVGPSDLQLFEWDVFDLAFDYWTGMKTRRTTNSMEINIKHDLKSVNSQKLKLNTDMFLKHLQESVIDPYYVHDFDENEVVWEDINEESDESEFNE